MATRLFLRTRGMGNLHSRLDAAARLPLSCGSGGGGGGVGSSVLVGLDRVRNLTHHHHRRCLSGRAAYESPNGSGGKEDWWHKKEYRRVYLWGTPILVLGLCWITSFKTPEWRQEIIVLEATAEAKKQTFEVLLHQQK